MNRLTSVIKYFERDLYFEFDFDGMLELDKKRRELIKETDELRKKRNQMSIAIGQSKKSNEEKSLGKPKACRKVNTRKC